MAAAKNSYTPVANRPAMMSTAAMTPASVRMTGKAPNRVMTSAIESDTASAGRSNGSSQLNDRVKSISHIAEPTSHV